MSSGFRYILIVLVAAAAVFAGLSLWPSAQGARQSGPAQAAAPGLASAPPPLPPSAPPIGATINTPHRSQPSWTFLSERDEPREERDWLYAQVSVVLRIKPGGPGHPATSLTRAPLTILKGTRLWPLRKDGEWVMVRSPSGLLGYVHNSEIDTHYPVCKRRY